MAAAKLANMRQGERTDLEHSANWRKVMSQPEAAERRRVSTRAIQRAVAVRERGIPELIAAVEAGTIAVSLAAVAKRAWNLLCKGSDAQP